MRAAGVEPPAESPHVVPPVHRRPRPAEAVEATEATAVVDQPDSGAERTAVAPKRPGATPPGTPLPSRPVKRIGTSMGPSPDPKPLLTPVDSGRPRRLSRTRRAPSASARWAVRITAVLLLLAFAVVLALLLLSRL
jgi:hypothetical protein